MPWLFSCNGKDLLTTDAILFHVDIKCDGRLLYTLQNCLCRPYISQNISYQLYHKFKCI